MPLGRRVQTYTAQRITFGSNLPASQIIANIEAEIRSDVETGVDELAAGPLKEGSKHKFEDAVNAVVGPIGFMSFGTLMFDDWFGKFYADGGKPVPILRQYRLGNPVLAQTMIKHEHTSVLNVPVKLIVVGDPSGSLDSGEASVVYDLPSSLIAIDEVNDGVKKAALGLDAKLEALVRKVTGN